MKEILLLALLSFTFCAINYPYPIKCEDGLYEAKIPAIKHLTDKINNKYEIYVKGTCKGGMGIHNSKLFYCDEEKYNVINDLYKKTIKVGKSCKVDEECLDKIQKTEMTCKGGKCEDKCGNKCEKNQICEQKIGTVDTYACFSYLKEGESCKDPYNGICTPGTICYASNATGDKKCTKIASFEKGADTFVNNDGANLVCKTGFSLGLEVSGAPTKYSCVDITSEEACKKDTDSIYKSKITFSNTGIGLLPCEKYGDVYYPAISKAQLDYFADKVVGAFNKIKVDNVAKKEIKLDLNEIKKMTIYFDDKKFKEKYLIFDEFNYLKAQGIINDKGEVEKNKKKCLEFVLRTQSSSTLKMSIALALFALLL